MVQDLLAERRRLVVANERLRLELAEAVAQDRANPRIRELDAEIRRLTHDLAMARTERDQLREGLDTLHDRLSKAFG